MFDFILLVITGLGVGFVSSFFGIGGGAIIIPVLFSLFPKVPAQALIPVSLGIIFLNTSLNVYNWRSDNLLPTKKSFIIIALGCLLGAVIGSSILYMIDSQMVKRIFASILLVVALKTLLTTNSEAGKDKTEPPFLLFTTSIIGSFISAITGLGGGVIYVPMLMSVIKLPLKFVSPFSNVAMLFASIFAFIPHFTKPLVMSSFEMNSIYKQFYIGHVNVLFILVLFIGAFISSRLGSHLNKTVSFQVKKYSLSLLLVILAVKTFMV
jgi:uncharacterized membrane protein YfcA